MSPYNAYTSYSTSKLPSYSSTSRNYTSNGTSNYLYKPSKYSSTLPSTYSSYYSPSRYSYTPSSYLSTTYKTLSSSDKKWTSDVLYKSPSLTRSVSATLTTPRTSLPTSSLLTEPASYESKSWLNNKSNSVQDKCDGRVGLNNLGNTCFMNAVLQCLCHTQPLTDYCIKGTYLRDVNHRSPTHGDLVKVFAEFVRKMVDSKATSPISPYQLRTEVQRYAPRFSGDNQQDAQEFLRYLLQGIHDDINRVKFKSSRRYLNDSGRDSNKAWSRYTDSDDSLIVDLFAGQLKSTLTCTECNKESITYDPFWDLSLPIPEGYRNSSLKQCLSLFSSPEILDGSNKPFCEACKRKTPASKKIEVNKFPKVLVVHLKRFSASSYGQKLKQMVESPLTLTSLSELSSTYFGDTCTYSLYGVVDHDGSNNSGHYIAKCQNPMTKEWYEFNDSRVSKATSIVSSKTYILFYIKV